MSEPFEATTAEQRERSVTCERDHCQLETFEGATVTIKVGDVEENWCFSCAKYQFGVDSVPQDKTKVMPYVTLKNIALVLSWMLILALLLFAV